jgi:hypothetical protein
MLIFFIWIMFWVENLIFELKPLVFLKFHNGLSPLELLMITPMLGFQSFWSANKILKGIEAMNMVKKRQVNNLNYSVLMKSNTLINCLV